MRSSTSAWNSAVENTATDTLWRVIALAMVRAVIGVDTSAYFFGRAIGGPKIAPAISP